MIEKTNAYKLYGIPYLGSMVVEFLMEEVGIEYDMIMYKQPKSKKKQNTLTYGMHIT